MGFWKWFVPGMKVKRWLACLFAGILCLALGVAYVLVHFYREARFPEWTYYLTLQFIPRLIRGAIFLLLGAGLIVLALHQLSRTLLAALAPEQKGSLAEAVYQYRRSERGKRVVVIGGSTGTMLLLRALRRLERDLHVRVLITGLESSRIFSRLEDELRQTSGRILFPTREDVAMYAELSDGTLVLGEDAIAAPGKSAPIRRVFLGRKIKEAGVLSGEFQQMARQSQAGLEPNPEAIEAIERADLIILGPASLYTGILAVLTPPVVEAIRRSRAPKLLVGNIMTEPGQTDGYSVSAHLQAIQEHAGLGPDFVLVNSGPISDRVLARYRQSNAEPLRYNPAVDRPSASLSFEGNAETILVEGAILLQRDVVAEIRDDIPVVVDEKVETRSMVVIRHDDEKLARAIGELIERQLAWGYSS